MKHLTKVVVILYIIYSFFVGASLQNNLEKMANEFGSLQLTIINQIKTIDKQNNELKEKDKTIEHLENTIKDLHQELEKYNSLRQLDIVATAYEPLCEPVTINGRRYKGCSGITATGYDVRNTVYKDGYRVVATDPSVIPLGSLIYIETENRSFVAVAEDTGGAIKGNRIDILMKNKEKAFSFGKQSVTVTVLREGRS